MEEEFWNKMDFDQLNLQDDLSIDIIKKQMSSFQNQFLEIKTISNLIKDIIYDMNTKITNIINDIKEEMKKIQKYNKVLTYSLNENKADLNMIKDYFSGHEAQNLKWNNHFQKIFLRLDNLKSDLKSHPQETLSEIHYVQSQQQKYFDSINKGIHQIVNAFKTGFSLQPEGIISAFDAVNKDSLQGVIFWLSVDFGQLFFTHGFAESTLLHIAAHRGLFTIAEYLIVQGLDVNVRDIEKRTPLHIAALTGNIYVAKILFKYHVKLNALSGQKWTALHCAARAGNIAMCELLVAAGADFFTPNSNIYASDLAYEFGHYRIGDYLTNIMNSRVNE